MARRRRNPGRVSLAGMVVMLVGYWLIESQGWSYGWLALVVVLSFATSFLWPWAIDKIRTARANSSHRERGSQRDRT